MRILHLYKDYAPVVGGIENHIKLLAEAQAARGHQVTVLVTSLDQRTRVETINGVRVIYAARRATISSAPISLALPQILARERADVAHLHYPYPWGELSHYFFGHALRTVMTYHSDIVRQRYLGALYAPLRQRVLGHVDKIIATSPNYIASSPVLSRWKEKCVVVPYGIVLAPFENVLVREVIGLRPAQSRLLLFVGQLRYYKGLNYLLRALPRIPESQLVVIGTGAMEREWKQLASELGLDSRVKFVGEVVGEKLAAYFAACDVFVLPASERSEAFGIVQLEAMAAGKPIVSCDVGTGVAWVNRNEVTGLVVPPRDAGALAGALMRLLEDKRLREKMGAAGRARVRSEFALEKMVEGVMEVYGTVG